MSVALGYVPFTRGSGCRKAKRERASEQSFTVIELSVFCCCRRTSGSTEMRKHFYKMLFHYRPLLFISFPSLVLCQSGSDRVNKTEPGSRLVHYCWIHNWPPSIDVSMSICLPSAPILYSIQKHISVSSHSSPSWATYMPVRAIC